MPASSPWYQGAVVPLAWTNTDVTGTPQDAGSLSSISVTVTLPDGTTTAPAVTRVSTGSYTAACTTTQTGHHLILWKSVDSTYPGAYADSFEVQADSDPTIVSLAEAKEILQLSTTTQFDLLLQGYNAAATAVAEHFCGSQVTRQVTELVRAQGRVLTLGLPPVRTDLGTAFSGANRPDGSTTNGIVSITPVLTYGFMYPLDELLTDGPSGIVRHFAGLPFFYSGDPYAQFKAVYWAGQAVIGAAVYEGAKIILEHLFQVKRGGTAAQDIAAGESVTMVPGFSYAIPNRALELFQTASGQASRAVFA